MTHPLPLLFHNESPKQTSSPETSSTHQQPTTPFLHQKFEQLSVRTLILSDIHLGTPDAKAREVRRLLKRVKCDTLILNGDIIDAWALKRGGEWSHSHSKLIRTILKKMETEDCKIIYIRGNHDDILERFSPLLLGNLQILKEHIHTAKNGKKYLVVHGDGFDSISTNHKWIAVIGSVGYDYLLAFNRYYNMWRAWRGKEYFSLSKAIKTRVKSAVSFVGKYEEQLQSLAHYKHCEGIICGHIHSIADKVLGNIHYLNSGDWVETLSFIIETHEGDFNVHHYTDLSALLEKNAKKPLQS